MIRSRGELKSNDFETKCYEATLNFVCQAKPLLKANLLYEIAGCLKPWPYFLVLEENGQLKKNGKISKDESVLCFLNEYTGNAYEKYEQKIYPFINKFLEKVIRNGLRYAMEDYGCIDENMLSDEMLAVYKKKMGLSSVISIAEFCDVQNAKLYQISEKR